MAITMQEVRAWLDPEEPNYGGATALGPAALPFLLELVRGGDLGLASKATYLASLIESDRSVDVLTAAAQTNEPVLRVAAASGLKNLKPAHAERMLNALKGDPDPGVRKVLVRAAGQVASPRIAAVLRDMAQTDREPFVRAATADVLAAVRPSAAPRGRQAAGASAVKPARKLATRPAKRAAKKPAASTARPARQALKRAARTAVKRPVKKPAKTSATRPATQSAKKPAKKRRR